MICSECGKNPAIIFTKKQDETGKSSLKGYCYNCAKEKKPVGTVEGLNTLQVIHDFCIKHELDMPIVNSLYKIINGDSTIEVETNYLMNREKKDESTY